MSEDPADRPPVTGSDALSERIERLTRAGRDAAATSGAPRPARRARRHPAARARAAAIGLSIASTAGLTAFFTTSSSDAGQVSGATFVAVPTTTSVPSATTALPASTTTVVTAGASTVVDGGVFSNRWGDVQVEVTFGADGSLVAVDAIRTPDDRGKSIRINQAAVPQLDSEALALQSASIHTVSGATYTSDDYRRSLQSAIDAARSANLTRLA